MALAGLGTACPTSRWPLSTVFISRLVAHAPGGIPSGTDWKIFAPYMSKTLLHRIDDFNACAADWFRRLQDPRYPQKPPFGVYESGIFSGGDERTGPRVFNIERTQAQKDGSVRVYVRLAWWEAPVDKPDKWRVSRDRPYIWHVAPIVVRENGRLVVDDVIYLRDETRPGDVDWRLSQSLSQGCDGPRWVGYHEQADHPEQKK
jgi:hypothetical protein